MFCAFLALKSFRSLKMQSLMPQIEPDRTQKWGQCNFANPEGERKRGWDAEFNTTTEKQLTLWGTGNHPPHTRGVTVHKNAPIKYIQIHSHMVLL